jgi:phage shock protein PspC (stress-responsive transcriptional regulator)
MSSRIRRRITGFAAFWYDFIVGDDWLTAAGVVAGLALTYALSRTAVPAWWLLPVLLVLLLPLSLWRATRRRSRGG